MQYNVDSLYYDQPAFINKYKNHTQPLFISLNTQSLYSKHANLKSLLLDLRNSCVKIDILALQETWNIPYTELVQIPDYTFTHKQRTSSRGGGVGFYIRNDISYKIVSELSHFTANIFESLTIEAKVSNKTYLLTSIYRSPNPPRNITAQEQMLQFNNHLDTLLTAISRRKLNAYIFLDSNINLLNLNTDHNASNYHDLILNNGYLQSITRATRIQNGHFSLIDHIITNSPSNNSDSGILINDISDHFTTFILPDYQKKRTAAKSTTTRIFNSTNIENFKLTLRNLTWRTTTDSIDTNTSYSYFWNDFKQAYDTHFPKITLKANKNKRRLNNFLTPELLAARSTKLELHKLSLASPTPTNIANYRKARNEYNTAVRRQKVLYYEDSLSNSKCSKKTWTILKEAANLAKNTGKITEISINGTLSSDEKAIANTFNHFFSTVGSTISNSIPPSNRDPLSYCPDFPNNLRQLELEGCGPMLVGNTIQSMVSKSSTDLDGISSKLLKSVRAEIERPLSHIFSLSLSTGIFPEQLKASRVVPIHKAGDTTNCDNYRPISLVNAFSKILEKIVCTKLVHHLESTNLMYKHQYGFLKGRSTEHALTQILNTVGQALNENKYCVGVFLDLKKAFDVVPHDILLKKLTKLGVSDAALTWFASYLSNRTQKVDINGTTSDSTLLDELSVFQGTSLGPILFLCFINDLPLATDLFSVLYADDTTGLDSDSDLQTLLTRVSMELNKLANWFRSNRMALNVSKTKYMIFHVPNKRIMNNPQLIYDGNAPDSDHNPDLVSSIERIHNNHENPSHRSFKLLGIYLDENLNFNSNTTALSNKLSRALFFINRVKLTLSPKALKALYTSFFHSHLLYCPIIYSCTSQGNINRLLIQQKKAIRTITKSSYNTHTEPLFQQINILPLEKIILQAKLTFMHSVYYEHAPTSFLNIWTTLEQRHPELNLRNATDISLPFPRIELYKKLPIYSLPSAWNETGDFRYQRNRFTFQMALREFLTTPAGLEPAG
jgi:hypothetical protein